MRKSTFPVSALRTACCKAVLFVFIITALSFASIPPTQAAINNQINFQARVLNSSGGLIPDGDYNLRFRIYSGGDGQVGGGDETLAWTETYSGANQVTVKNGYVSVKLNSINADLSSVDFSDSTLWLSVEVGGTSGTPAWDGEMDPMMRFTSVPYAFNAERAETAITLSETQGANTGTLAFDTLTASQTILLPDGSGTVCLSGSSSCGFASGSGSAILQGGNSFGANMLIGTDDTYDLIFKTNAVTRLTISSSGAATFTDAVTALSFSGDGSALTDLNATNITSGTLSIDRLADGSITNAKLTNNSLGVNSGSGIAGGGVITLGGSRTLALGNLTEDWVQAGGFDIILDNAGSELRILESSGDTFYGEFDVADLSADRLYTFPDVSGDVTVLGQVIENAELANDSITISTSALDSGISGGGLVALGGTLNLSTTLGEDVDTSEIEDGTLLETDLSSTNAPTDDYILSYDQASGGFTWVNPSAGGQLTEAEVEAYIFDGDNTGTLSSGTLDFNSLSYLGVLSDAQIADALTVSASGTVADGALSANVSLLGSSIELGTETTGNYVATLTAGNGLSGDGTGVGSTPTVSLGDFTANWTQAGAFDLILDNADSELQMLDSGGTYYGIFDVGSLSSSRTYTFPDASGEVSVLGQTIENSELVNSSVTIDTSTVDSGLSGGGALSLGGSLTLLSVLGDDIQGSEIEDGTIEEVDLKTTGVATDNYALTYDLASGGFTWVDPSTFGVQLSEAEVEAYIFDADNTGTLSSGTLALGSLSYTGNLTDAEISNTLTIGSSSTVDDGALSSNVTLQGNTFNGVNQLLQLNSSGEVADSLLSSNVSLLGQTIQSNEITDGTINTIDIASDTILAANLDFTSALSSGQDAYVLTYDDTSGGFTLVDQSGILGAGVDSLNSLSGDLSLQGTTNQVAVTDNGSDTITLSLPQDIATNSNVEFASGTFSGNLTVQGGGTTLGTITQEGSLVLNDGNGQTTSLLAGDSSGDLNFILPNTLGSSGQCLKTDGSGDLSFSNCNNGSGPNGSVNLQDAYDVGNAIVTSDNRNIAFTLSDTTIDSDFIVNIAGTGNVFDIQDSGTSVLTVSDGNNISLSGLVTVSGVIQNQNALSFEGATQDGFETTLAISDPTADRTITLPNASGTVCLTTGNCSGVGGTGDVLQGGNSFGSLMTIGTNDTYGLAFETDNSERLRIDTSGNIGIGDSTPLSLLTVGAGDAFQVNSSGAVVAATGITSSGTITFSSLDCSAGDQYLTTNASGVLSCGNDDTAGGGGEVTSLNSLTGNLNLQGTASQITVTDNGADTITLALDSNVTLLGQSIESNEITDGTIQEIDLEVANAPTDGYVLTYDSASGGFAWVDSSTVGSQLSEAEVETYIFDADNTGTLSSGTLALDLLNYTGDLNDAQINDALTISSSGSVADGALSANVSLLGQTISSSEIANNTIQEIDLEVANAPTDGYVLTYDSASGGFAWVDSSTVGSQLSEAEVETYIFDADNTGTLSSGTLALDLLNYTGDLNDAQINDALTISSSGSVADGALSANVSLLGQTIGLSELESNSVNSAKIVNGSITGTDIASSTVANTNLVNDSITITAGTGLTGGGAVALGGSVTLNSSLGTSIDSSEIVDGTIQEVDLESINGPTDGYVLSYDSGSGGFEWVAGAGGGLFTDAGSFAYLTATTDDLVLGSSTVAGASLYFDESASNLYLGTDGSANGTLTLYNSAGSTPANINTNASGDLNLSSPSGTVVVGDGSGDIQLQLDNQADTFAASKSAALSSAYSDSDYAFTRSLTNASSAHSFGGRVLSVSDTSAATAGTTVNYDLMFGNAAPTGASFTGNLLRLQTSGADRFVVDASGNTNLSGDLTVTGANLILGTTNLSETDLDALDNGSIESSEITNGTITGTDVASSTITNSNLVNSSLNVNTGSGLSGGGNIALGGSATLSLSNLTADWTQSGAFDITLNNAGSELRMLESAGGTYYGTLDVGDLGSDQTFTFLQGGTVLTSGNVGSYATTGVTAGNGLINGGTTGVVTLNVGAGTGVTVAADAISVNYGATAGTAVQGNTQITVTASTGLSGGGSITLGSGGSVSLSSTLGTSISSGEIVDGTIQEIDMEITNAPTNDYVLTYDSATGGFTWVDGSTASGISESVVESYIFDADNTGTLSSGTLALNSLSYTGTLSVSYGGTGLTSAGAAGSIAYSNGTGFAFNAAGTSGQCLLSNGTGAPSWGDCGGSGGPTTLQVAYDNGSSITTTDARDITFNLADTTTDSSFIVNLQGTANLFDVQNNGTSVLTADTNGRVGIGDNTPTYKLDVAGTGRFTNDLLVDGNTTLGNAATDVTTITGDIAANTDQFFVDESTGFVGIGDAVPDAVLQVTSANDGQTQIHIDNTNTGGQEWYLASRGGPSTAVPGALEIGSIGNGIKATIQHDTGNFGIGTRTPTQRLEVDGIIRSTGASTGIQAANPTNSSASATLSWLNDIARIRVGGSGVGAGNGLDIQTTSDVSMLRIENGLTTVQNNLTTGGDVTVTGNNIYFGSGSEIASGSVLQLNPASAYVDVRPGGTGGYGMLVRQNSETDDWFNVRVLETYVGLGKNVTNPTQLTIADGGNIGIGTGSPGHELAIQAASPTVHFLDNTAGADDYFIHNNDSRLYFLLDTNDDGAWESPHPLYLAGRDAFFGGSIDVANNATINGASAVRELSVNGGLMLNYASSSYDVWIQGGTTSSGGDNRNLAILGYSEANGDRMVINYGSEYANGVDFQSNVRALIGTTGSGRYIEMGPYITGSTGTEPVIRPSADQFGSLGTSGRYWWRAYIGTVYQTSDMNKKKDIASVSSKSSRWASDTIKNMKFYNYRLKTAKHSDPLSLGPVTQDMPRELTDEKGTGVDTIQFMYTSALALQNLQFDFEETKTNLVARIGTLEQLYKELQLDSAGYIQNGDSANFATLNVSGATELEGNLTVKGLTTVQDIAINGQILSKAKVKPTVVKGSALGQSGIINGVNVTTTSQVDGTDTAGTITVGSGINAEDGTVAEITFSKEYKDSTPRISLTPLNAAAVDLKIYIEKSSTGFVIKSKSNLSDDTVYKFDYIIIGSSFSP